VLNSAYLHFAFFIAIVLMPRHEEADFDQLTQADEFGVTSAELVFQLNEALFQLAWYGHFVVGLLVLIGTHFKKLTWFTDICNKRQSKHP